MAGRQPTGPPPAPGEVMLRTRAWLGWKMREGALELAQGRLQRAVPLPLGGRPRRRVRRWL